MTGNSQERNAIRREQVSDERKFLSSKLSDLSRGIGFGLAALIYVFPTSSSTFAQQILHDHRTWILVLSVLGGVTIILDYLQYAFGYFTNLFADDRVPLGGDVYSDTPNLYGLAGLMFILKQIVAMVGVMLFCALWIFVFFSA
jgi:hypothetical protein